MQSTQATQAHRAPRCRHVLSRARCVVYLGPPSFTFNTATPIRLYPPVHPYLCGVVLSTDTCHPSSNGTRAVAPLICKQCLTPRPNTETPGRFRPSTEQEQPRQPDGTGICRILSHAETTTQSSSKICRHGRTSWATSSPPRQHACFSPKAQDRRGPSNIVHD